MIVNIRGTHGSGKSTIVRTLLDRGESERLGAGKRPEGYRLTLPSLDRPLYVVGPYETACGGCDAVSPFALIFPRVEEYALLGHVLFEGALVSTSGYGRMERCRDLWGERFVAAFLDTPLDLCLSRILERRAARGNTKPLDPTNTLSKWEAVAKSRGKIESLGVRTVTLDHRKAVSQLLGLYNGAEAS